MRRLAIVLGTFIAGFGLADPAAAQTETVEYYGLDQLGSVRVVFDQNGQQIERMDYGPFGENLKASIKMAFEQYAQLARDAETGQDYAQARNYSPFTGRLNRVDPVYAGLFDPQQWNRYAYVRNNPVRFVDPSGLVCVPGDCGNEEVLIALSMFFNWSYMPPIYGELPPQRQRTPPRRNPGEQPQGPATQPPTQQPNPEPAGKEQEQKESDCSVTGWGAVWPDYGSFSVSFALTNPFTGTAIGITVTPSIDRWGNVYISAGPNVGKSVTQLSATGTVGWVMKNRKGRVPSTSAEEVDGFLTGWNANAGAGFMSGAGATWNSETYAIEVGGYFPQVGVSGQYGVKAFNLFRVTGLDRTPCEGK